MSKQLLDAAGRRRSPATLPEFHAGRSPRNKGMRYPADPPTIEEIVSVMRHAGDGVHGRRLRGLIVVLWRAGLRICEALALAEADLDARRGSLLVRRGKGGRRREVGMDDLGLRTARALARRARLSCRSGRCSASSTAPRADAPGPPPPALSYDASPARPAYGDASRRTSSATPTPSRWPVRVSR
jgi:integrase